MKNKSLKFVGVFIVLSLVLVNFSVFTFLSHEQKPITTKSKFIKPITSDPNDFISVWNTTKTSSGSSNSNQVRLPLEWNGNYSFTVFWGDGNSNIITISSDPNVTHTYASEGIYTITITGMIIGWCFNDEGDLLKIIEIEQWGCLRLGNSGSYFEGCENLVITAIDNLNLTGTTTLRSAFFNCPNLGDSGNMNGWDVSNVTDMGWMFCIWAGKGTFNQPIGAWNVSSATNMHGMFRGEYSFNQPISNWNVSSVTDMNCMFQDARSFNQPIDNWDVSSVTDMNSMFHLAIKFDQSLSTWDVSSVTDMGSMFSFAIKFDQSLGTWDVSSVTTMSNMLLAVTLSTLNYDNLLLGWSQLPLQIGVDFHAGRSKFSSEAADARQFIIANFSWTITDGGLDTPIIPGYNLILLVSVLFITIAIVIKKKLDM